MYIQLTLIETNEFNKDILRQREKKNDRRKQM